MRIIKSCGSPSWGGIEIYILRTAKKLIELGHDVSVLCLPDSNIFKQATEANIPVLPLLSRSVTGRISSIRKIRRHLDKFQTDVIHTHLSNDLWVLVPAAGSLEPKPKLFLSKCMESGVTKKDLIHRHLYRNTNKIIAVSNFIKQNVLKTCPVNEEDVIVINDAIELDKFDPALYDKVKSKTELGFSPDDIVISLIGRMAKGKGHEIFFRSVRQIINSQNAEHIKFMVVGGASHGEGFFERKLLDVAAELNVKDKIKFTGFQSDIPYYLSATDILAFPSFEESFGGTVAEAMAMGVPAVASNSGGVPDIVVDGVTGILTERNNPDLLTEKLLLLANDSALRRSLAAAGIQRAKEHFEMTSNIEKFVELYGK